MGGTRLELRIQKTKKGILFFASNQHFLIGESHPREVINIMHCFTLIIDMEMGDITKVEFLFIKNAFINFFVKLIFTHNFK